MIENKKSIKTRSKRGISLGVAILLVITIPFYTFCENRNYLALGDSITSGYGLLEQKDSFTEIIAQMKELTLLNYANDGDTSADLLEKVKTPRFQEAIKKSDFITISIGGNDLLRVLFSLIKQTAGISENATFTELQDALLNVDNLIPKIAEVLDKPENRAIFTKTIETFSKNLDQILAEIKKLNPNANIVLLTLFNPLSGAPVFRNVVKSANEIIAELNAQIKQKPVTIADVAIAFKGRGLRLTNILYLDVHPNKAGNKVITSVIADTLQNDG